MKSRTRLSNFTFTFHFPALEKEMATHSSVLAWRIPGTGEPGRLQSMRSWRVGHDWVTSLSLFTFMHWRRKWQPTPVFLPGESQGWKSLVGCCLWGCTESDTTEETSQQQQQLLSYIPLFSDFSLLNFFVHKQEMLLKVSYVSDTCQYCFWPP